MTRRRVAALVNNRSLQTRILALCLLIALLSTGLVATFSYVRASEIIEGAAYEQAGRTVHQAASYINDRLKRIQSQVYYLIADPTFLAVVESGYREPSPERVQGGRIGAQSKLQNVFSSLRLREPAIDTVYLYTPHGSYYELIYRTRGGIVTTQLFRQAQQSPHRNLWLAPGPSEIFMGDEPVIPLVVPFNFCKDCPLEPVNHTFLVLNISARFFEGYLASIDSGVDSLVYVASGQGQPSLRAHGDTPYEPLIASPDLQQLLAQQPGSLTYQYQEEPFILTSASIEVTGWQVVSVQPKRAMTAGLGAIQRFTLLVAGLSLALSLLLSGWLARSFTRPLAKLSRLMRRVSADGELDVRFHSAYHDEVGQLGRAFNKMIEDLARLIQRVEQEQRAKRVAELEALQAQINPHFLYNTLDAIYWKALMKDTDAAAEMVVALSRLFRLGLNGGREITTIAQELDHARNYLEIQKLCYGESFDYSIHCDPALADLPMVKIIVQPLVENSLTHGLGTLKEQGRGPGQISICVETHGDALLLEVVDNGSGFDPDALLHRLERPPAAPAPSGQPMGGYGLRNVHTRLRLHYGAGYAISLASVPYQRTSIRIKLPMFG